MFSITYKLYKHLQCLPGTLFVERKNSENGDCRLCFLHCWFGGDCNSCTARAYPEFRTRHMDSSNTTRFDPSFHTFYPLSSKPCHELLTFDPFRMFMLAAFLVYVVATLSAVLALVFHFEPHYGQTNILVYLGICSLMGSLTVCTSNFWTFLGKLCCKHNVSRVVSQVVSIKAIGIAIKLTLDGMSQIAYPQTWFFLTVAVICVITQLIYLNKVSIFDSMPPWLSVPSFEWMTWKT